MTNSTATANDYNALINHLTTCKALTKTYRREGLQRARRDIIRDTRRGILSEDHSTDLMGSVTHAIRQVG